jgi:hypothetical protein
MYITRLASKEVFSPSNKIHREVGWAKDLSAQSYNHIRRGAVNILQKMTRGAMQTSGFGEGIKTPPRRLYVTGKSLLHDMWPLLGPLQILNLG